MVYDIIIEGLVMPEKGGVVEEDLVLVNFEAGHFNKINT